MRRLRYTLIRWQNKNVSYAVKNVVSSLLIYCLTCNAIKEGVFDEYSSTKTCLFAILMCNIWSGTFNSITVFYSEANYIIDDLNKFLSVRVYVFSNFLMQTFICLIEAMICRAVFNGFYDYSEQGIIFNRNIEYFITFFSILISADMLGFAIGMVVTNIASAMSVIPIILIVQFLFSGCLFELQKELEPIAAFTTAKWGFAALGTITNMNSYLQYGKDDVLFEYSTNHLLECWAFLAILSAICFILSGIFLYIRINKPNR